MDTKPKPRRRHSAQFKAEVIAACAELGASVAAVARRFELNDNLVHQWRRGRGTGAAATVAQGADAPAPQFIALSMASPGAQPVAPSAALAECVRIEIKRGAATVSVSWPIAASGECAGWLRELLR